MGADALDALSVEVIPSQPLTIIPAGSSRTQAALQLYTSIYHAAERPAVSLHLIV